jgi:hypothetical protein
MRKYIGLTLVLATLAVPMTACTGEVEFYDAPHHEYRHWDRHEEHEYRVYLEERHHEYVKFDRLNQRDQDDYWMWRRAHPDGDRGGDRTR